MEITKNDRYITLEEYETYYNITLSPELKDDVEVVLAFSSTRVNAISGNKIEDIGFDKLTPHQQQLTKKATILLAHHYFTGGLGWLRSSTSINAGQISISQNNPDEPDYIIQDVYSVLQQANLFVPREIHQWNPKTHKFNSYLEQDWNIDLYSPASNIWCLQNFLRKGNIVSTTGTVGITWLINHNGKMEPTVDLNITPATLDIAVQAPLNLTGKTISLKTDNSLIITQKNKLQVNTYQNIKPLIKQGKNVYIDTDDKNKTITINATEHPESRYVPGPNIFIDGNKISAPTYVAGSNIVIDKTDARNQIISATGGGGGGSGFIPDAKSITYTDETEKVIQATDIVKDGKKQEVLRSLNFLQNEANQLQEQINSIERRLVQLWVEWDRNFKPGTQNDTHIVRDTKVEADFQVKNKIGNFQHLAFDDLSNIDESNWKKKMGNYLTYDRGRINVSVNPFYFSHTDILEPDFLFWVSQKDDNILTIDKKGIVPTLYVPKQSGGGDISTLFWDWKNKMQLSLEFKKKDGDLYVYKIKNDISKLKILNAELFLLTLIIFIAPLTTLPLPIMAANAKEGEYINNINMVVNFTVDEKKEITGLSGCSVMVMDKLTESTLLTNVEIKNFVGLLLSRITSKQSLPPEPTPTISKTQVYGALKDSFQDNQIPTQKANKPVWKRRKNDR